MDPIRDLLVIVDPTAADQPALEKAGTLAATLGASLEILACETPHSEELRGANEPGPKPAEDERRLRAWIESLSAPLRARGVNVRGSVMRGEKLHEALIDWIRNSPADLVLKDTHHHSLLHRTFLGSTDSHLIRDCTVPLLLAKPTRWRSPAALAAAVDPGHAADPEALLDAHILEWTARLGQALKAAQHVVHAYVPVAMPAAADFGGAPVVSVSPELLAAEQALQVQRITSLVARSEAAGAQIHVEAGTPSQTLPALAAQCRIDLLVMGWHARGRIAQAVMGSTAERVLEVLPCDVLVVRSPAWTEETLPF